MSATDSQPTLRIQDLDALEGGTAESRLKRMLGRGVYVHEITELKSGELEIALGTVTPRDLSDCRDRDNVLKFITIRDVYTLRGEPTGEGYYIIQVPERGDVISGIERREQEILDKLDYSMAQAIYERVYDLTDVRSQLNPILEILRWVRREGSLSVARIENAQRSDKTDEYLTLLDNLDYLNIADSTVEAGEYLQSADMREFDRDEFGRRVLGDVVQRGYYTIRDQFRFSMLGHYQKYAGAYYFDAIQKDDHQLWLDLETVAENLRDWYNERRDPLYIGSKLSELDQVGVVQRDGEYVRATEKVYNQVAGSTPVA